MERINAGQTEQLTGGYNKAGSDTETLSESESRPEPEEKNRGRGSLMTVAEMGRILGLKKTDRYWLIHKGLFETRLFLGKTWVVRDSFENWYASQTRYRKVDGEAPGRKLLEHSYGVRDIAGMLGLCEATVYEIIKRESLNTILIDQIMRVPKEDFEKWYAGQERYRTQEDRERDATAENSSITMPEMARLLGLKRSQVYMILKGDRYKDIFEILVIAGKKRITRESFERFLEVQDRYRICEDKAADDPEQAGGGGNSELDMGEKNISCDDAEMSAQESGRQDDQGTGQQDGQDIGKPAHQDERQQSRNDRPYLGISEAAEMLRVSDKRLCRWIWEGTIPSRKVGRKVFLERKVLEKLLERTDMREIPAQEIFERNMPEQEISEQTITT